MKENCFLVLIVTCFNIHQIYHGFLVMNFHNLANLDLTSKFFKFFEIKTFKLPCLDQCWVKILKITTSEYFKLENLSIPSISKLENLSVPSISKNQNQRTNQFWVFKKCERTTILC